VVNNDFFLVVITSYKIFLGNYMLSLSRLKLRVELSVEAGRRCTKRLYFTFHQIISKVPPKSRVQHTDDFL